jgi:hypothetical protein
MNDHDFRVAFNRLERYIEERWGIPVILTDIADPNTGDLNGATISVDWQVEADVALFVLAHLFGHTAQWATDDEARELGIRYGTVAPPPEQLEAVRLYEVEAARYSIQLFQEAGLEGFEQWLSDWTAADWLYLEHFYKTGEQRDFREFFQPDQPLLEPLAIPRFVPKRWESRFSF